MDDIPAELEGTEVEIEIEGGTEALADDLRAAFDGEDEDVVFGHAFGGVAVITIVTTFGKATLRKLGDYWSKIQAESPKTKLRIGDGSITLDGFSTADLLMLLNSPVVQDMVARVKKL